MVKKFLSVAALLCAAGVLTACSAATGAQVSSSPSPSATSSGPKQPQYVTSMHKMKVGKLTRTWETLSPRTPLPASAPIIVMLSGISATPAKEIPRDHLLPYAANGEAKLVYPLGYKLSWNAGGCCGKAAKKGINDLAFMRALVAKVNPGRTHPIFAVGYSNGGRLAYRIACTDPLFDATAVVKAMPLPGCVVHKPLTLLQIDGTTDPAVPLKPGDKGGEKPPATVEVARLRSVDSCRAKPTVTTEGGMQLNTWHCKHGNRIAFALYKGGGHSFPQGDTATPSAGSVIWAYFTHGAMPGPAATATPAPTASH